MAYIHQDEKKELTPAIKAVLKQYGVKGTISIQHHSTLIVTLQSGLLNLVGHANEGRKYHRIAPELSHHDKGAKACKDFDAEREFVNDLISAMQGELWFNNGDIMSDYHHIAYFINIRIGKFDKPYKWTGKPRVRVQCG